MKITAITTYIPRVALGAEIFYSSQCSFPERNSLLVRIDTDEGICGWGEGGQYGPPEPVASCINDVLAQRLIGEDPLIPSVQWDILYAFVRDFGSKGPYIEALSALDIAMWDILGKSVGKPVSTLLGGARRRTVTAYATGCYYRGRDCLDLEKQLPALRREAKSYVEAGFDILKLKIGLLSIKDDIKRVEAIRETVGDDVILLADANHAYNAFNAIRVAKELEALDVRWLEEPVVPEDRNGYRRVRGSTSMAITGGECEYTRYGFRELIEGECVDIAQPDLCVAGGISEWIKIHGLASSFGVWTIPHVWGSGVALAAALQVVSTLAPFPHTANPVPLQNEPVVEYDRNHNPLRDDLLGGAISFKHGSLCVPEGPGLGIGVDQCVLERFI